MKTAEGASPPRVRIPTHPLCSAGRIGVSGHSNPTKQETNARTPLAGGKVDTIGHAWTRLDQAEGDNEADKPTAPTNHPLQRGFTPAIRKSFKREDTGSPSLRSLGSMKPEIAWRTRVQRKAKESPPVAHNPRRGFRTLWAFEHSPKSTPWQLAYSWTRAEFSLARQFRQETLPGTKASMSLSRLVVLGVGTERQRGSDSPQAWQGLLARNSCLRRLALRRRRSW